MKTTLLILSLIAVTGCGAADQPSDEENVGAESLAPLSNFSLVSPGIYRGGMPLPAGIDSLKRMHFKTDVSLSLPGEEYQAGESLFGPTEGHAAREAGLRFDWHPMTPVGLPPSDDDVNQALAELADPATHPVYVHCLLGHDRTGMIVALYRVFHEHFTPARAWQEALAHGFGHYPVLAHYFEKRTGYRPPGY